MRIVALVATTVFLNTFSMAKPLAYTFADIGWGLTRQAVKVKMAGKGYSFYRMDEDGDLIFKGKISQEDAQIAALFTPANKLVRIQVVISPRNSFFIQRLKIIKESLVKKYGNPDENVYSFASPYKYGDGYETQAIRSGKGTISSKWMTEYAPDADGIHTFSYEGLSLKVNKDLNIYVTYNERSWNKEYDRRYNDGNKNF